ncbi:KR-domain-containing protein [Aspergillus uvarum CBS 121591]|uniref:KR-domain-containing protein n=1 Tax=Aspergillus uvarum CBS 121591 TaxID=1448315 RepID=A0A319BWC1_9EURO|nr:KR-domain-containing protein [Aspergillus uvarum CBS 121591]PYH77005.1 KR-domain-containing protein [Aspergillus uvarum CBS 121591]
MGSSLDFAADLPSYERKKDTRYIRKSARSVQELHPGHTYNPLLGWKMPSEGNDHIFRQLLLLDEMPWIRDNDVAGDAMIPFAGFVRLAVEAFKATTRAKSEVSSVLVRELHVKRSLIVLTWTESGSWSLHAHGRIEAGTVGFADMASPARMAAEDILSMAEPSAENAEIEYQMLQESGIYFGPAFRNMTAIWSAPGVAVHETVPPSIDHVSFQGSPAAVDVVTLDSVLHSARSATVGDEHLSGAPPVYVPVYSSRCQISTTSATAYQKFTTVVHRLDLENKSGRARVHFVIFAGMGSGRVPYVELDMTLQRITQRDEGFHESLVPHFGFLDGNKQAKLLGDDDLDPAQQLLTRKLSAVSRYFLAQALKMTANDGQWTMPSHYEKFLRWAEVVVAQVNDLEITPQLIDEVSKSGATGKLLCAMGQRILEFLRGEVQHRSSKVLSSYVAGLGELNPKMRILEVGAGTGAATLPILEALSGGWGNKNEDSAPIFDRFVFTDISSGFFKNARHKLTRWPQLVYQKLGITRSQAEQGIEVDSYDLVIAVNVLHATPDITTTIQNVRSLLKPGTGNLGRVEHADNYDPAVLPFALLPGWWLASDEYRASASEPLMPQDCWHRLLTSTGFSGVEGGIDCGGGGTFWTSRVDEDADDDDNFTLTSSQSRSLDPVTICGPLATHRDERLAKVVAQGVGQVLQVPTPRIQSLKELHDAGNSSYVLLDSAKSSFLATLATEDEFSQLKRVLLKSKGVLWVSPESDNPEYARIKGILRTLRLEDTSKKFIQVDDVPLDTAPGVSAVAQLTLSLVQDRAPTAFREQEFVWRNGMLHVPRLRRLQKTTETFALEAGVPICKEQDIWDSHGPEEALRLSIQTLRNLDSIHFERHRLVDAVGINFRDILSSLGTIPWSPPGCEGAGTVEQVGPKVSHVQGGFSTYVRISGLFARRVPDSISTADAASLPTAYSTALVCLDNVAQLQRGESVLIHAGSGAVGQACINVAQSREVIVFVTAGSVEKRAFLHKTFAIPKSRIYNSRTPELRQCLLNETDGKGVDGVVNRLSGELLQETWSLVADHLSMRHFLRNKPAVLQECLVQIVDMLENKVQSGFRKLQSGNNIGKIVAILGPNERPREQLLQANATYLITGGTGGIGRVLVPMLLENGAANVILLGRSGESNPDVSNLIQQYNRPRNGIHVRAIACDVASRASLYTALHAIQDLPPVRGVIHCARYLRDSMFMNATFDDWRKTNAPKIDAAWHIHELLPALDFFVALASAIGVVGNIGQSLYAGTSTFLDAFAQYRARHQSYSVSINLPVIDDVGFVTQREGLRDRLLRQNVGIKLSTPQVLAVVKGAIIGAASGLNKDSRAIVYVREGSEESQGWEDRSHYFTAARRKNATKFTDPTGQGGGSILGGQENALETLCCKVSSITMIDREDVTLRCKLAEYGLDSLVAVELRHWVRREFGVDLALTYIVGAENLQALADRILSSLGIVTST